MARTKRQLAAAFRDHLRIAERAGDPDAVAVAKQILAEERAAA